jgi:hypothetical protein
MSIIEDNNFSPISSRIIVLDDKNEKKKIEILVDDDTYVSTFKKKDLEYSLSSLMNEDFSIIGIIKRSVEEKGKLKNELVIWIEVKVLLQRINEF